MDGFLQANQSLMRQFGSDAVYKRIETGQYNPALGSVVNTETDYNIKVRVSMPKLSEIQQPNLIGKSVANLFILPIGFEPSINDKITVNLLTYTVVSVITQHGYADTVVGYKLVCTK